jgi:hypothetical protein
MVRDAMRAHPAASTIRQRVAGAGTRVVERGRRTETLFWQDTLGHGGETRSTVSPTVFSATGPNRQVVGPLQPFVGFGSRRRLPWANVAR